LFIKNNPENNLEEEEEEEGHTTAVTVSDTLPAKILTSMGRVPPSRIVENRRPFYDVAWTSCRRRWGRWNRWIAAIQR